MLPRPQRPIRRRYVSFGSTFLLQHGLHNSYLGTLRIVGVGSKVEQVCVLPRPRFIKQIFDHYKCTIVMLNHSRQEEMVELLPLRLSQSFHLFRHPSGTSCPGWCGGRAPSFQSSASRFLTVRNAAGPVRATPTPAATGRGTAHSSARSCSTPATTWNSCFTSPPPKSSSTATGSASSTRARTGISCIWAKGLPMSVPAFWLSSG